MKLIHKTAIAAALSSFAMGASAMDQIQDTDLSQVTGQDGVSIAANLDVNVGSFQYSTTNNTGTGSTGLTGTIGFNNISFTGTFAMSLDIVNGSTFLNTGATVALGAAELAFATAPTTTNGAALIAAQGSLGLVSTVLGLNGMTGNATQLAAGSGTGLAFGTTGAASTVVTNFYPLGSDVVQIAIPQLGTANGLNFHVGSITMGTNGVANPTGPSFGAIAMNNIQMQGTTVYIWAH
jgi:hypothetical protein